MTVMVMTPRPGLRGRESRPGRSPVNIVVSVWLSIARTDPASSFPHVELLCAQSDDW